MAEFLTTRGISHHIEEIVKSAKEEITFVTPYLKFSELLYQRLQYADSNGIKITVIYGKTDLSTQQDKKLKGLTNLNLYFLNNLHAKCYFNEETLILSSMNLHQFSEENNREMGMLIDRKADRIVFQQIIDEVESIKSASQTNKESVKPAKVIETKELDWSIVNAEYFNTLKRIYSRINFRIEETIFYASDFPCKSINFSTSYGFGTFHFNLNRNELKEIKNKFFDQMGGEFSNYRVYWSHPYERLCIYSSVEHETNVEGDQVKYYMNGINKVISALLRVYPNQEK